MKSLICLVLFILVILPLSYAIVSAVEEACHKKFKKNVNYLLRLFMAAVIIALLSLSPKCSYKEKVSTNGETSLEHYEPKYLIWS